MLIAIEWCKWFAVGEDERIKQRKIEEKELICYSISQKKKPF